MTVTPSIDLRGRLTEARDQGTRQTCLAFTLSDMNRLHASLDFDLSAEYLYQSAAANWDGWLPHGGLSVDAGQFALEHVGQPSEALYPYSPDEPSPPLTHPPGLAPMYALRTKQLVATVSEILDLLKQGKPLTLGLLLNPQFMRPLDGVITYSDAFIPNSGHAVLAVGVGTHQDTGEDYLLIRNSWGEGWGMSGHAWLPAIYLTTHVHCVLGA